MIEQGILNSILKASNWWLVRGESGKLWKTLFQPFSVVAHGIGIPRFEPLDCTADERGRKMLGLADYFQREVNDFIDVIAVDDVVITPDAGSRKAWFGLIRSDCYSDPNPDQQFWMRRNCEWIQSAIVLVPELLPVLPAGKLGTVFEVSNVAPQLRESLLMHRTPG